jgi:hypothetical protein
MVKQIISSYAYKLQLPTTIKVHPMFNVHLLRPTTKDFLPS